MPVATRQPPAVHYPFAPSRRVALALASLSAMAAGSILAWLSLQQATFPQAGLGAALWAGCSLLAWRWWRGAPSGELAWDGLQWQVRIGAQDAEPCASSRVCADLSSGLWVRLDREDSATQWLWLAREADPGRWLDLRRALFATAYRRAPAADALPGAAS